MTTLSANMQQQMGYPQGSVPNNFTLGPNRYIPPTFSYSQRPAGGGTREMNWNTMQEYYMPQQNSDPFTNRYMGNIMQMLQGFGQQYGSPNRQYIAPRFNTYQPDYSGFNPMASYYQRGMNPNQMFDPRMASLFGAGQLGGMVPNSQNPQMAPGVKPLQVPVGG